MIEFTKQVTLNVADCLEIDYSDADSIVSAHDELVSKLFFAGMSVGSVVETICDLEF